MDNKMKQELDKIKPAWQKPSENNEVSLNANDEADDGFVEKGLEGDVPSNYENSLVGNPKSTSGFEVKKAPGRLG
jgi:hypothetical protein